MDADYIKKAQEKAKVLFDLHIELSKLANKKFYIPSLHIHFGDKSSSDYLLHRDKLRRAKFHNRFKNNIGYNNPKSGLFYSARILW